MVTLTESQLIITVDVAHPKEQLEDFRYATLHALEIWFGMTDHRRECYTTKEDLRAFEASITLSRAMAVVQE